jgi:hypothetical protein
MTGDGTANLLGWLDGQGAGTGGFGADIDDGGTVGEHLQAMVNGFVCGQELPAVTERIGRDVKNTHNEAAGGKIQRPGGPAKDGRR